MDWITTANGLIALVTGLAGLIGTGIGAFFAVKAFVKSLKQKNLAEIWALVQEMADAAMKQAEESGKKGADKKRMVIDSVKASCKAAGIDVDAFVEQLADYVDQTIAFVNGMQGRK